MKGKPLRILHMDGGRVWAGGQNQVRLLMRGLAEEGVQQLCLTPVGSPLGRRLADEGLPVREITWRGGSDPRAAFTATRAMSGYDIAHAHDAHALQVAIPGALLRRVPLIGSRRVHFRTRGLKWNRAARVVAISDSVRTALLRGGVAAERMRMIPSGVDTDEIVRLPPLDPGLRERLGLEPDACLIGNIGHLVALKGQALIPAAAARLPGTHWVIAGEGPERAALERSIVSHEVADRVHLLGPVPDARRILQELDLFVFPSTSDALGTSVLDAMAAGVPVVGADAAGPAEILRPVHAATGTAIFHAGDVTDLVRCMRQLLASPELKETARREQTARLRDFEWRTMVESTMRLYHELVTRR